MSAPKNPVAARALLGDGIIAFLLLNEVRHRIIARLFGVSREDSNLTSTVAMGSLAQALQGGAARMRAVRVRPSAAELGIGAAVLRETAHRVGGDASRATPFFGSLVALAVLDRSVGPMARGSVRGIRGSFHGGVAFSRRVLAFLGGQ